MIDKSFVQKCQAFIEPNRFRLDEPMKLHTTFKIGGPADCLIFPASMEGSSPSSTSTSCR